MAKTPVSTIVARIKRRADYDITDSDLDILCTDAVNDALKIIYQLLVDRGLYTDVGQSTTLTTVALQSYIDISTSLASAGDIICLSERTNDKPIDVIPYFDFIQKYPDPTANTSTTPDEAAIWNNRLYLGPTPSGVLTVYAEYTGIPADISLGETLPYKSVYDPLVIAIAKQELTEWLDNENSVGIAAAKAKVKEFTDVLITGAAKNIGMIRQSAARGEDFPFRPRIPES